VVTQKDVIGCLCLFTNKGQESTDASS